jgi:hypothetical protein
MALRVAKAYDSPYGDETVVNACQMSIDTSIAMPVMMNASPADADDPRIPNLVDMFPWANPHGCHDDMACQCAAPTSFIDEQPSSPPPDPALDLPLPGAPGKCDCVDRGDRSGPPDVLSDVTDKAIAIYSMLGFQYDTPVELMHCSLGDGLSDGGGTVAGCANDIVARLSLFRGRFWLAVINMLAPFTSL